jgi:hypothetical protein
MVRVTVDVFSGRPNPSWIAKDDKGAAYLKEIAANRGVIDDQDSGYEGLGFRGVRLDLVSDSAARDYNLPNTFLIANGATARNSKGAEIAERIIGEMLLHAGTYTTDTKLTPCSKEMQQHLLEKLREAAVVYPAKDRDVLSANEIMIEKELGRYIGVAEKRLESLKAVIEKLRQLKSRCCTIEICPANLSFWNSDSSICWDNNCYNYATNRRTNTFAQPGRGSGHPNSTMQCANVSTAAKYDGAHVRFDCFPDSEKPRPLMALVVDPNWDYHWYRYVYVRLFTCRLYLWAHKPGHTKARITDNSGQIVWNPETCDRGGYTDFCGYFYGCRSMQVA